MSILHAYHSKLPFRNIKGKPYITVSAKGISNDLSDTYNDGADFGPDTLLNATSPNQYGPPYTQTSGIQEAINYVFSQGGGEIVLSEGVFQIDANYITQKSATTNGHVIEVPYNSVSNPLIHISIRGSASLIWDLQTGYNATPSITPTNMKRGTIIYNPTYLSSPSATGSAFFGSTAPPSGATFENNVEITLTNLTFTEPQPNNQSYLLTMVQLDNFTGFYLKNVAVNVNTPTGALNNPDYSQATGISINQPFGSNGFAVLDEVYVVNYNIGIYANNAQHLYIKQAGVQYCATGLVLGNVQPYGPVIDYIDIEDCTYPVLFNNPVPIYLYHGKFQLQTNGAYSSINWSNPIAFFTTLATAIPNTGVLSLIYGEIEVFFGGTSVTPSQVPLINNTYYGSSGNIETLYSLIIHQVNAWAGSVLYPFGSNGTITSGPTAGTVTMQFLKYDNYYVGTYKKLMIAFSGYENDTTTNQTISYPLPFSTNAVITGNNTGLTVSASTSGITITSPNSTTTYSGIVIVEGY